jgi:transcriptional regulator with XRE-family HTH domain
MIKTVGDRIKELREARGLTQDQLMQAIGVSQATISRLENAITRTGHASTLQKVADVLNTTQEYLLTGETKGVARREKDVLAIYREIDPSYVDAWLDMGQRWKRKVKAKQAESA